MYLKFYYVFLFNRKELRVTKAKLSKSLNVRVKCRLELE